MSKDDLALASEATPAILGQLHSQGQLTDEAYQRAINRLNAGRDNRWYTLLHMGFLCAGLALIAAGLLFVTVKHWDVLGHMSRFAMIAIAMTISALVARRKGFETQTGRVLLSFAILLLGGHLALIGITYKTNAPIYQLFALWAGLSLCWVWVSQTSILWILWLWLVNATLVAFINTQSFELLLFAAAIFQTVSLIAWEILSTRISWLNKPKHIGPNTLGVLSILAFVVATCMGKVAYTPIGIIALIGYFAWYRFKDYNRKLAISSYLGIPFIAMVWCYRLIPGGMEATIVAVMVVGSLLYGGAYLLRGAESHVY